MILENCVLNCEMLMDSELTCAWFGIVVCTVNACLTCLEIEMIVLEMKCCLENKRFDFENGLFDFEVKYTIWKGTFDSKIKCRF